MAMSLEHTDMFDELGDELMLQLSNSMNDSATVAGIIPFPEIVDHPQFVNAEMLIHSLSTENLKIPFTAVPTVVTTNFQNRKVIVFSNIMRLDNGRKMDTLVIPLSEITDIAPMQSSEHLFTQELDVIPGSTEQSVDQQTSSSEEDLIPCYQEPLPTLRRTSPFGDDESINFPPNPDTMTTSGRRLPLLHPAGVDLLMLYYWHKTECPSGVPTFAQWRTDQGFEEQMSQQNLIYDFPCVLTHSSIKGPQRQQLIRDWEESYPDLGLGFKDWYHLYISTKTHDPRLSISSPIQTHDHESTAQAEKELSAFCGTKSRIPEPLPTTTTSTATASQEISMTSSSSPSIVTLSGSASSSPTFSIISDAAIMDQGGQHPPSPNQDWSASPPNAQTEEQEPVLPPLKTWETRIQDCQPFPDWEVKASFDANNQNTSRYFRKIDIKPSDFLPGGRLDTIYIPSYLYIPDAVFKTLELNPRMVQYCRLMLWHKLSIARQRAQAQLPRDYLDDEISNDWMAHLSRAKQIQQTRSFTYRIDVLQHVQAQKMNKEYKLPAQIVYDTLFRPMERLCGIDMPLHNILIKARFDMSARRELFETFLQIIDFDTKKFELTLDHHSFYQIMTGTRHLSYANLTPHHFHATGPFMTILTLDPWEEDPREKPLSKRTLAHLARELEEELTTSPVAEPLISLPLQDGYMERFPQLNGIHMSIKAQKIVVDMHNDIVRHFRKTTGVPKRDIIVPEVLRDQDQSAADETEPRMSYSETIQLRPQTELKVPVPIRPEGMNPINPRRTRIRFQ